MEAIGIFVILLGLILQGMHRVENNPPNRALVTFFGKRIGREKKEGWRFFFLQPFVFGHIDVNVERRSKKPSIEVRTPDNAKSVVPIAYTYIIHDIKVFLDNKGEGGVEEQIEGKLAERTREWAVSPNEGPANWEELRQSELEAVSTLAKRLGANSLTNIPFQKIPTIILMKYFSEPKPKEAVTEREKDWIGPNKDWAPVREELSKLSEEEQEGLEKAVKNRREEIENLRAGSGSIEIGDLGITIKHLNLGEIKVQDETAKAAESKAREEQERRGEIFEIETDSMKAQKLIEAVEEANKKITDVDAKQKLSFEEAYRMILDYKMTKDGHGFAVPGLAPALASLVATFLKGGK